MKQNIIIILAIFSVSILFAEQKLSLAESIKLAKENNKELQKARDEIGKYRQDYNTVKGNLFPQISLSGGYSYKKTKLMDSAIIDFPLVSSLIDSTASANDQIIAGSLDQMISGFLPEQETEEYSLAANIKFEQALFLGGKLINGINIAKKLYSLQEKKYYLEEQSLIYKTQEMYYKTKLALEVVNIQKEAFNFAELYFQQVNDMFTQGLVSEYDKLRAELEVKKMQPQVLEAEKNADLALESFANHLNLEDVEIILTDDIMIPEMSKIDLEAAISQALENRMEIELSEIGVDVSKVNLRYEKGNFLPNIGLNAEYNLFGQDEEKIESNDFGSSYSVGIGFSMPLFTGFANSSKIKKAKYSLHQAKLDHKILKEMIELDVKNAYLQWQADKEKLASQKRNIELAELGMKIANARYENQVSNQLEVIDAQLQLKSAKLSYMNAKYAVAISYQKLLKAIGEELK